MSERRKYFLFSLVTVVLVFTLLEGTARLFALPGSYDFIERRLIEQNVKPQKDKGDYWIFLYGESTMHGNHLYPKSTIKLWLDLYFKNLFGEETSKKIKTVNLGRLGEPSDFIAQAFFDTIVYKPDMAIFYSAQNDFIQLENRRSLLKPKKLGDRLRLFFHPLFQKSCFISAVKRQFIKAKIARSQRKESQNKESDCWYDENERKKFNPETDLLDPNSDEFAPLRQRWERNILKIIEVARKNTVSVIFLNGVAKYRDYAPFSSVHSKLLTEEELSRWEQYHLRAERRFAEEKYSEAIPLYEQCLRLDPQYALTYFRLGRSYEKTEDFAKAKKFYMMANDRDFFPIRAPSLVNEFYDQLDSSHMPGVKIIKTQQLFDDNSPQGMAGDELLADPVHPTINGQALIAMEIVKYLSENEIIVPKERWRWDQLKTVEQLKKELGINADFEFRMHLSSGKYQGSYYDKAIEELQKALSIRPHSVAAKSQLAWTYWIKGERKKAVAAYRELYQQTPEETEKFFQRHPTIRHEVFSHENHGTPMVEAPSQ